MTEAGAKPEAVRFRAGLQTAREALQALTDPEAREAKMKDVADLKTRLEIEMEARRHCG